MSRVGALKQVHAGCSGLFHEMGQSLPRSLLRDNYSCECADQRIYKPAWRSIPGTILQPGMQR